MGRSFDTHVTSYAARSVQKSGRVDGILKIAQRGVRSYIWLFKNSAHILYHKLNLIMFQYQQYIKGRT